MPDTLGQPSGVALYRAKDGGRDQLRVCAHVSENAKAAEDGDESADACP